MGITIEQAKALVAISEEGTFSKAGTRLGKAHTGVMYTLNGLEESLGVALLNRAGYRTKLTPVGERVLVECRSLLSTESRIESLCEELKSGWEPYLQIVYDGIIDIRPILNALGELRKKNIPTTVKAYGAFLGGVESEFKKTEADLMISVLPPQHFSFEEVALPPIPALLVADSKHELFGAKKNARKKWSSNELGEFTLITVRGSDRRLNLSTRLLDPKSQFLVNDFHSKKQAILNGLGFGWLPHYLIEKELKSKRLIPVRTVISNEHTFRPRVFYPSGHELKRGASLFLKAIAR